ncbi:DUF4177 domain-containing protein [Dokdonella koreensis]|uniref:DUF4177 domain-containing protein n=1 Tax=Dokdonella koreensis DS-123 TaxID=1300342 RepID=A0A160DUR4_9GAMM|nr:DUF4177 domain-containing protein [Dokdonella koreensis]ANB18238.1 Hypothetical protein I596_2226 [Dokdonella koreensis DS-123]
MNHAVSWEQKVLEIKPKLFRKDMLADLNEVLKREGQQGWELVNAVQCAAMNPVLLFLKRPR